MDPGLSPNEATRSLVDASKPRQRALKACDACRSRRSKCEDVITIDNTDPSQQPHTSCKACREIKTQCTFEIVSKKRGPPKGYHATVNRTKSPKSSAEELAGMRKRRASDSHDPSPQVISPGYSTSPSDSFSVPTGSSSRNLASPSTAPGQVRSDTDTPSSRERVGRPVTVSARQIAKAPAKDRDLTPARILMGMRPETIEHLLAVYFTHVHNVWPVVFKPSFHPSLCPPVLLLAILSISSCVAPTSAAHDFSPDALFRAAEDALHRCRMESRIEIVQALVLLSLRQTGNGEKGSAFLYAGRASSMALDLGLNLAGPPALRETAEAQIRSRVYWNCYVLDKVLAEETGRPDMLRASRSTIPFPSILEPDELEFWPPTSATFLASVRGTAPTRSHVLSCFNVTCKLAMIVEEILNMEAEGPMPDSARQASSASDANRRVRDNADRITGMLNEWRQNLPPSLWVDASSRVCPPPHFVVNMTWFDTATILLHSRFVDRDDTERQSLHHTTCTAAADHVVELLACLDRYGMLTRSSADVIHVLSLATLFHAYNSTSTNLGVASKAKANFAQCCHWLRSFSGSWPAASAHKLFFEGLIQGGIELGGPGDVGSPAGSARSPQTQGSPIDVSTSSLAAMTASLGVGSHKPRSAQLSPSAPPVPLRNISTGQSTNGHFTDAFSSTQAASHHPISHPAVASSLFQLPQMFWNQLTNPVATTASATPTFDPLWDYNWNAEAQTDVNMTNGNGNVNSNANGSGNGMSSIDFYPEAEGNNAFNTAYMDTASANASGAPGQADFSDEVYNAMVSFMRSTAGRPN